MYTVFMSPSPPSNFPELEQDKATDVSPMVQRRSQRARVQRLAVAQRFIGSEGSVSDLTMRAIWRLERQAIETLALNTRPDLVKGKRLPRNEASG